MKPKEGRSYKKITNQQILKKSEQEANLQKEINFKDIFTNEGSDLIFWCVKVGLIKEPTYCKLCRRRTNKINSFRLSKKEKAFDRFVWRCKNKDCGNIEYIRKNSQLLSSFPRVNLRILLIYIFHHFCFLLPPSITNKTFNLSFSTIGKISELLTKWIVNDEILDETFRGKLDGKNKIVEIDESCFFKRKYNRGRLLGQIWGFGAVERESGKLLVEVVEKRNAPTLLPLIQKWISKESLYVISDEWKPYKRLKKLEYNHICINHSKQFVLPSNPQIHTQTIENRWGQIKSLMRKSGRISRFLFPKKVKEITWRINIKDNIQAKLLEIILKYNYS